MNEEDTKVFPVIDDTEKEYEILKQRKFKYKMPEINQIIIPAVGNCVSSTEMDDLREKLLGRAKAAGFPYKSISKENSSFFDKDLGEILFNEMKITPSVAATLPMWQFLNLCLVPDLVYWRWGDSKDHFTSLRRNYLGTQWHRYYLFSENEKTKKIYFYLNDSEIADLYERTSTNGYPNHIVDIALWFEELKEINKDKIKTKRDIFRDVIKQYNSELGYRLYFALSEEERHEIFTQCFNTVLENHG